MYATVVAYKATIIVWSESIVSHSSLVEDLIAWNWAVAYAIEPKGTGT